MKPDPNEGWNIYLVTEDHETRVFVARSMGEAIASAWGQALVAETERRGNPLTPDEAEEERHDWEVNVLQSCTLVGELENVDELRMAAPLPQWKPPTGEPLVDRLRKAAADLYPGDSSAASVDPIACVLEAADALEGRANRKEPTA